jgi:hypothetical protein
MNDMTRGAVAGLAGTTLMSVAMALAKAVGPMPGEPPPRKVARNVEETVGIRDVLPPAAFEASWIAQHFAYGTAAGVAYALVQRRVRLREPWPAGPVYGIALWAFGYAGWLPASGLYPPPRADLRHPVRTTIAVHVVYGTATAMASHMLDANRRPSA